MSNVIEFLSVRSMRTLALATAGFTMLACSKGDNAATTDTSAAQATCASSAAGITVPEGFCATIFADGIGHARHAVVGSDGTVYVNTWSGEYYQTPAHEGGFIVALRDTTKDGKADVIDRFGKNGPAPKSDSGSKAGPAGEKAGKGGTGIALYNGYLYAEEGTNVVRYALNGAAVPSSDSAEIVVSGLPLSGDHPMHPFVIDKAGNLYMNSGSATNSCQLKNRTESSPGQKPCKELATRAGIFKFGANKINQPFSASARYATGIRNAVGIAFAADGQLYSTQHGRDQLAENWKKLYTPEQGQNLPAEELLKIQEGADYGWPMCYFDNQQAKLVLAPEYGGDGGKAVGDCATKTAPVAFFPAHWAPDALLFYTGTAFPEKYRGGAFIAFHGSWNRAPGPQGGYMVAFVPFNAGVPAGADKFEKFADGFAEGKLQPDAAAHRPTGLALGPDGSLYITDDKAGRVWRVTYSGSK